MNWQLHKELIKLNSQEKIWLKNRQRMWTSFLRKCTNGQKTHGKMLNITVEHLIIREMQIKIMRRYHNTPVRKAIIIKTRDTCWWGCGKKGKLLHCYWECRMLQSILKTVGRFLWIFKTELPYNAAISCLSIYLKEMKPRTERDTCTAISIVLIVSFTIAKIWIHIQHIYKHLM